MWSKRLHCRCARGVEPREDFRRASVPGSACASPDRARAANARSSRTRSHRSRRCGRVRRAGPPLRGACTHFPAPARTPARPVRRRSRWLSHPGAYAPASTTKRAAVSLAELEPGAFATVVRRNSEIAVRLMRRLSSRLREADRQIQALMSRSGAARALSLVRNLAGAPDPQGRRVLPDDLNPQALMRRVGLTGDEALRVERVFARYGLLVTLESGRWALGPEQLVKDFLLYVEMQEQYDPINLHQLAEIAGLDERDAAQIARRVLHARLAERRGSQDGSDAYGAYLALKQRFEYAEG